LALISTLIFSSDKIVALMAVSNHMANVPNCVRAVAHIFLI